MEMTELMKKKIDAGREYRDMTMEAPQDKLSDRHVEGYATTFDQPYHLFWDGDDEVLEQVDRNAFDEADLSDVVMQYDHEGRVFARMSNGTLKLEADEHGLKVRADLSGTELGRQLWEEIRGGYTTKMSFGFTVAEDNFEEVERGKWVRTIRKIGKLYDVSAVSYPQNGFTEITARKAVEGELTELKAERQRLEEEKRIQEEKREALLARVKQLKGE